MILRYLLVLFVVVPIVELFVLLKLAELVGALATIALILLTGVVGAFLAKSQGIAAWRRIQNEFSRGHMPTDELLDGLMIFAGGVTLLTPGLITDTLGFCLMIPYTRYLIKLYLRKWIQKKMEDGQIYINKDPPETIVIDADAEIIDSDDESYY